ncbi:hypothetical protein [Candidatus Enterococcus ikei]|uniref:Uncharacterized protein n=1 Tax=Candidatus Enterococcus ikei TaxID=2815326 RepID=A0ABS3GX79_9ENTE|nr:hypothetical protein [Enterococcus sp. DIV0869a]MBO0439871.1 hypothetical protein [Enterococcus sp. DIV0869a]
MSVLDWLFIGLLSIASLCLVFVLVFILLSVSTKQRMTELRKKKLRNEKKQKRRKKEIIFLKRKSKSQLVTAVVMFFCGALFMAGSFYSRHYQQTHLSQRDSEAIVQGYYLINNIEEQLQAASTSENKAKISKNIIELAGRLTSYGARMADVRLSVEGQSTLTRMYQLMKELGVNLNNQPKEFLDNDQRLEEFADDIKKAKTQQKKVFSYFKVNEDALKKRK